MPRKKKSARSKKGASLSSADPASLSYTPITEVPDPKTLVSELLRDEEFTALVGRLAMAEAKCDWLTEQLRWYSENYTPNAVFKNTLAELERRIQVGGLKVS